jgi:hypothetical protein
MVFSHQFHTWDQGPLYLYTTTWSLHANSIHEIIDYSMRRDHDVELTEWSMVSCIKLVWRNHDVYTVVHGLMYESGEKRPWCIYRVVYGHLSFTGAEHRYALVGKSFKFPYKCLPLKLILYYITRHFIINCIKTSYTEWSMVSCMKLVRRDHDVV